MLLLLLLLMVLEEVVDDAELPSFLYLSLLSVGMARLRGSPAPPGFLTSMLYSPTISMLESESSSRDLREFLDDDLVVVVGDEVDAAWAIGGG